ncbi:MAG: tetratricopeptide repeat protein [Candidatus Polarisedimenticolia bacterium]
MMLLPPTRSRAGLLAAALTLTLAGGCAGRLKRPVESAPPTVKPPPPVEILDPSPVPAPPTEAELALDNARQAEARGESALAADLYARAARVSLDASYRSDAFYSLALLHLDPGPLRDLALAREELLQVTELAPGHPRVREARSLLTLIEELQTVRTEVTVERDSIQGLRDEAAALRVELDKKNQELKSIKQVLLQRKP